MGSVSIDGICPRCESKNYVENFHYSTHENYKMCYDCGYYKAVVIKKDENENYIFVDESKGFEFCNLIYEELKNENPFGCFRIEYLGGNSERGTLNSEKDYNDFVSDYIPSERFSHEIKEVIVSRLVENSIQKKVVFYLNP
jgi:hypothetical protein